MRRALAVLVMCMLTGVATAAIAGSAGAQTDDTEAPQTPVVQQLFVQTARAGSLVPVKGKDGVFTLTLRGTSANVVTFTDRPLRVAANVPTDVFLGHWDNGPFAQDPPNAALVVDGAPEGKDVFVFELTQPRYDRTSGTLRYRATEISEAPNGRLAAFADSVDPAKPTAFGRSSLFIDSLPSASVTVNFSDVPAGQTLVASFGSGFEFADAEQTTAGTISTFITAGNAWGVFSAGPGSASGTIDSFFCVSPGVTSVPLQVQGGGTVSVTFYGQAAQTFGPGSQTMQVPASAQQQGCGQ